MPRLVWIVLPITGLCALLWCSLAHAQVMPNCKTHPTPDCRVVASPIIDQGRPEFRQLADVNGDGAPDYCRFVGTPPNISLSCQLGVAGGGYHNVAYGFNAPQGTDLGVMPRALLDINADGRADYCRTVGQWIRRPGAPPALLHSHLSCILAEKDGFSSTRQDVDPSSFLAKGSRFELAIAPDGTPIRYVTNSDGSWFALGTDAGGTAWRLEGETQIRDAPGQPESYDIGTRLKIAVEGGHKITAADAKAGRGLLLSISIVGSSYGDFDFGMAGYGGTFTKDGYSISRGFRYTKAVFSPSVGYSGVMLTVWNCQTPVSAGTSNPCVTYFSGKQYPNTDAPKWDGAPPQSLSQYAPDQLSQLAYFGPLADQLTSKTDALLRTGVAEIDEKHWYEHSPGEWDSIQIALTQNGVQRVGQIGVLVSLGKFVSGVIGAGLGIAIGGTTGAPPLGTISATFITGWGNLFFSWAGDQAITIIGAQDADYCKSVNYLEPGCGAPAKDADKTDNTKP